MDSTLPTYWKYRRSAATLPTPRKGEARTMRPVKIAALLFGVGFAACAWSQGKRGAPAHDNFYWLGAFNKASTRMVGEQGIVPPGPAAKIAAGGAPGVARGAPNCGPAGLRRARHVELPGDPPPPRGAPRLRRRGGEFLRREPGSDPGCGG